MGETKLLGVSVKIKASVSSAQIFFCFKFADSPKFRLIHSL